ncbi:hypothetical protein AYI68_g2760 [Smittium mucronatum]|uniref:Uncharacterized protein n=1 Tax=Smittium mucronatum TaxID=133383 RepID=A0A1R0H1V1_9FUNG|nr:hypothetical protein AYI68_g2760 [Smittium mucronatum]
MMSVSYSTFLNGSTPTVLPKDAQYPKNDEPVIRIGQEKPANFPSPIESSVQKSSLSSGPAVLSDGGIKPSTQRTRFQTPSFRNEYVKLCKCQTHSDGLCYEMDASCAASGMINCVLNSVGSGGKSCYRFPQKPETPIHSTFSSCSKSALQSPVSDPRIVLNKDGVGTQTPSQTSAKPSIGQNLGLEENHNLCVDSRWDAFAQTEQNKSSPDYRKQGTEHVNGGNSNAGLVLEIPKSTFSSIDFELLAEKQDSFAKTNAKDGIDDDEDKSFMDYFVYMKIHNSKESSYTAPPDDSFKLLSRSCIEPKSHIKDFKRGECNGVSKNLFSLGAANEALKRPKHRKISKSGMDINAINRESFVFQTTRPNPVVKKSFSMNWLSRPNLTKNNSREKSAIDDFGERKNGWSRSGQKDCLGDEHSLIDLDIIAEPPKRSSSDCEFQLRMVYRNTNRLPPKKQVRSSQDIFKNYREFLERQEKKDSRTFPKPTLNLFRKNSCILTQGKKLLSGFGYFPSLDEISSNGAVFRKRSIEKSISKKDGYRVSSLGGSLEPSRFRRISSLNCLNGFQACKKKPLLFDDISGMRKVSKFNLGCEFKPFNEGFTGKEILDELNKISGPVEYVVSTRFEKVSRDYKSFSSVFLGISEKEKANVGVPNTSGADTECIYKLELTDSFNSKSKKKPTKLLFFNIDPKKINFDSCTKFMVFMSLKEIPIPNLLAYRDLSEARMNDLRLDTALNMNLDRYPKPLPIATVELKPRTNYSSLLVFEKYVFCKYIYILDISEKSQQYSQVPNINTSSFNSNIELQTKEMTVFPDVYIGGN